MSRDDERSSKNFTPEDRLRRKLEQTKTALRNANAQMGDQSRVLQKALAIVAEVAPERLPELGFTQAEAKELTA